MSDCFLKSTLNTSKMFVIFLPVSQIHFVCKIFALIGSLSVFNHFLMSCLLSNSADHHCWINKYQLYWCENSLIIINYSLIECGCRLNTYKSFIFNTLIASYKAPVHQRSHQAHMSLIVFIRPPTKCSPWCSHYEQLVLHWIYPHKIRDNYLITGLMHCE